MIQSAVNYEIKREEEERKAWFVENFDKLTLLDIYASEWTSETRRKVIRELLQAGAEEDVIKSGPFKLNLRAREVLKNGIKIELTQIEYAIVKLFMENSGKALAREEILDAVWGKGYFGELKIVDVNVRRLRLKIEDDAQEPKYISTVWGFGYKWTV